MTTKTIVIVGGGAGGLELAVGLSKKYRKQFQVTLIDQETTHIWKPHLHEVAAGSINSHHEQIEYLNLAKEYGFSFVWGQMTGLDRANKNIVLKPRLNRAGLEIVPQKNLHYDYLVMAVGSSSNDFGIKGVKDFAFLLDTLRSANDFHESMLEKILEKEERAQLHPNSDNQLKITIVGGGATGVELAAELTETIEKLSQFNLANLKQHPVKITLINAADTLLPGMPAKISAGALEILLASGVNVLNSTNVIEIQAAAAVVALNPFGECESDAPAGQKIIDSDLIVWAAGVKCPDFLKDLDRLELNRINQFIVNQKLQTSDADIFAIGDCAYVKWLGQDNVYVPPRAQAAHQMSDYLVKNIDKIVNGQDVPGFAYKDFGSLVSLGGNDTVGSLMGFLKGKKLFIEGRVAKFMYLNLYFHHQVKITGFMTAAGLLVGKLIQKKFKPKIKLH